jgi:hypothetical protein
MASVFDKDEIIMHCKVEASKNLDFEGASTAVRYILETFYCYKTCIVIN